MSMEDGQVRLADPDTADEPNYTELGASGSTFFAGFPTSEYNPHLMGKLAIEVYDKMKRSDPQVRASMRIVKAPLISAEWYMEPASDSAEDKKIAEFVWWNFNSLNRTFEQVLSEAMFMLDYGYYVFEKVFEPTTWQGEFHVRWKKFAPRHPRTIEEWILDSNGGIEAVMHNRANVGRSDVRIPIEKLLIFTIDEEGGNPEGLSLLRSAYESWYFKRNFYKVDGIQKERHGIGIPDVEVPPNATPKDKALARQMARNLRTNDKAYILRPPGFKVGFLELKGQPVDALESAVHHGVMITMNVLAQFLALGTSDTGSRAISEAHQDMFTRALKFVANLLAGVFNQYAIRQLVDYNFTVVEYPKLKVRKLGDEVVWRTLAVAIRNLVESGVVTPDPLLEAWIRQSMDMPKASPEAMARPVEDRLPKPGDYGNRVDKPDGA
jgi:hypothetical protein